MHAAQQAADLPAYLLGRGDFITACNERNFCEIFRLIKKYAGYSSSKIARLLETTPSHIGRVLNGKGAITTIDVIERAADGLHIPGSLLGLASRTWEAMPRSRPVIRAQATRDAHFANKTDGSDDVLRREMFGISAAGAAFIASIPKPSLPSAGRVVDPEVPAQLVRRTARLRRLDNYLGGSATYRIYVEEFLTTRRLLKEATYSAATGNALRAVAAEQAQQAGWAAFDGGAGAEAKRLYETSLSLAEEAQDSALAGNALTFLSYQLVGVGKDGVDLAAAACRAAGPHAPASVRALLQERLAWTYAVAGMKADSERSLAGAEDALAQLDPQLQPDWSSWVDHRELQIMAGRCYTMLGRPLRAVPALEQALSDFDDTYGRDKALYLSFLAQSYIDAGEVEQAASTIDHAREISIDVASVRPGPRIAVVLRRLQSHANVPHVADVLDRGSNLLRSQPSATVLRTQLR